MTKFLRNSKKFLSVFMAVMMLMTAWVFVAPEKAEAAYASFSQAYTNEYYYASGTNFIYQTCLYYSSKDNATATNWLKNNGWTPVGTNFNAGDGKKAVTMSISV